MKIINSPFQWFAMRLLLQISLENFMIIEECTEFRDSTGYLCGLDMAGSYQRKLPGGGDVQKIIRQEQG